MFERKGVFLVPADKSSEEQLMEIALEAGADDIQLVDDQFEITCPLDAYSSVTNALEAANIPVEAKQLTRIPANTVDVTDLDTAKSVLKLIELLDDHDDVQGVAANFNISNEIMAAIGS